MKKLLNKFWQWGIPRNQFRVGPGIRGQVHKVSVIKGGTLSVVLRFGIDEPKARLLLPGTLLEVFETREGIPPPPATEEKPPAARVFVHDKDGHDLEVTNIGTLERGTDL